jgi:hypothetical protein
MSKPTEENVTLNLNSQLLLETLERLVLALENITRIVAKVELYEIMKRNERGME